MTQIVDPWVDQLIQFFGSLDENLSWQEQDIIRKKVSGSTRLIARNFARENAQTAQWLNGQIKQWSESGLQHSYMQGALRVSPDPFTLNPGNLREYREIQEEVRANLQDSLKFVKKDTERFIREARSRDKITKTWASRHGIKGAQYADGRKMSADAYADMQSKTASQKIHNLGTLHAAQKHKVQFLEVQDGPECGWEGHHDGDRANGKIVNIDEDEIILLSHPSCVRIFIPRPDLNKSKTRKAVSKAAQAAKRSAITSFEIHAIPTVFKALFVVEDEIVDEGAARFAIAEGTLFERLLSNTFNQMKNIFDAQRGPGADILPFHWPPPDPEPLFPDMFGTATGTGDAFFLPRAAPSGSVSSNALGGVSNIEGWKDDVLKWGDALLDHRVHIDNVPDFVKRSVKATNSDSEGELMKKIKIFADWVQKERVAGIYEESMRAANFVAKKKQWNEFIILKSMDRWATEVRGTWTKYGPRTTVDLTDWLRGRVTFTKTGVRRSITLNPASAIRTSLGIAQDGTILGNLRWVPNHFFSAAVEINDFGNLESELRFNPFRGGRMRILFEAPRPKMWEREGLAAGQDFVDFREGARAVAGHHQDWVDDLQVLSKGEMDTKWAKDRDWRRYSRLLDDFKDDEKFAAFAEKVDAAVDERFTDDRDVQLWLSVVADTKEDAKKIYRGYIWVPDEDVIVPAGATRAEKVSLLEDQFEVGTRIDEFASDWYTSRGTALEFSEPDAGDIGILYRVSGARSVPTGAMGAAPSGLEDQVFASGSYVVRRSKYDGKLKRFVVDLEYLSPQVDEALAGRRFGVEDFTFREIFGELKKMRAKDVIFDLPIFNKSVFDISAELKIPIEQVKSFVNEQVDRGLLKFTAGGRYQGIVSFNPPADLINMIADEAGKQTISGTISFSSFVPNWFSFLEPQIGATWTRTIKEVAGKETEIQKLIANVRLSGLEFFERATNLELSQFFEIGGDNIGRFADAVKEVDERIRLFLIKNQRGQLKLFNNPVIPKGKFFFKPLLRPRDIAPLIEERLLPIMERPDIHNRVEVFHYLVEAIRGESTRAVTQITKLNEETGIIEFTRAIERKPAGALSTKILKQVAAINETDSRVVIENKLQDLMFFLRASTLDTDELAELLDGLEDIDLHLAAIQLEKPRVTEALNTKLHFDLPAPTEVFQPGTPAPLGGFVGDVTIINDEIRSVVALPAHAPDLLEQDVEQTLLAFQRKFPTLPWEDLAITTIPDTELEAGVLAAYIPHDQTIVISENFSNVWGTDAMANMMHQFYGAGPVDNTHIISHEVGHWIWEHLSDEQKESIWIDFLTEQVELHNTGALPMEQAHTLLSGLMGPQGVFDWADLIEDIDDGNVRTHLEAVEEFIAESIAHVATGLEDRFPAAMSLFDKIETEINTNLAIVKDGKLVWQNMTKAQVDGVFRGFKMGTAQDITAEMLHKGFDIPTTAEEFKRADAFVRHIMGMPFERIAKDLSIPESRVRFWFNDLDALRTTAEKFGVTEESLRTRIREVVDGLERIPNLYTANEMNQFTALATSAMRDLPEALEATVDNYLHSSALLNTALSRGTVGEVPVGIIEEFDSPISSIIDQKSQELLSLIYQEEKLSEAAGQKADWRAAFKKITGVTPAQTFSNTRMEAIAELTLRQLLGSGLVDTFDQELFDTGKLMEQAIDALTRLENHETPTLTWRGIRDQATADMVASLPVGTVFDYGAFSSSSLSFDVAKRFSVDDAIVIVETKFGGGAFIGGGWEQEFVMKPGAFEVLSHEEKLVWGINVMTNKLEWLTRTVIRLRQI